MARDATSTIPIVMIGAGDLVAEGLAESLARPGGNVTGLTSLTAPLIGKRLQLLIEAVPTVARVLVLYDADPATGSFARDEYEQAAQALRVQLQVRAVRDPEDFGEIFKAASRAHADA